MQQQRTTALAGVLLAAVVTLLQPAALLAECCEPTYYRIPRFAGSVLPSSMYCADGAPTSIFNDGHCGVGGCNIFKCNCDGGCRPSHPAVTIKDIRDDSKFFKFHCKASMMNRGQEYTVEELASNKEACGCFGHPFGDDRDVGEGQWNNGEAILLSEFELVERPEVVISDKLHCHPGHGACVLEIEHIKSFTVTTGIEISSTLDFSKVVPASVSLTKKTDWAYETGTSLKYQCQAQEGYSTWISVKPKYYKAKTLRPTGGHTRRNGENNIPVCDVMDVYLPRINSHGSIAGDVHCHAEKLNL